jgi:predicted type IV restriction endonuclease
MCSANKQELFSAAGFTIEDPKEVPPYVGRFF